MFRLRSLWVLFGLMLLVLPCEAQASSAKSWPREILSPEGRILHYQPQVDEFQDNLLRARLAVSIRRQGAAAPVFGAIWMKARVETDRDAREVRILGIQVENSRFPDAMPEREKALARVLETEIPRWQMRMSLDAVLSDLALSHRKASAALELRNDPPRILIAAVPTVLVVIDGEPRFEPVEGFELDRVVNTPWVIFREGGRSPALYLKGSGTWYTAEDIRGPYRTLSTPPREVREAAMAQMGESPKDLEEAPSRPATPPQILVSMEPAELIATDGPPSYATLPGTDLLYIENTPSDVFRDIPRQQLYVLLAGRWFTAAALEGPWIFMPADRLPEGFQKIPPDSPKGGVLAHVAGTPQARDAVLDAQVPQTATVERKSATLKVAYDGAPRFEPIEGTSLRYAVNTRTSVIEAKGRYYACERAVWYVADQPEGPWSICDKVPEEIYAIPPSHILHPVTYVRVYDATDEEVFVGYTAGYAGCYIWGPTIVFGTGWRYRPWIGSYFIPRPWTWGFHAVYDCWDGWSFSLGFGWGWWDWFGDPWYRGGGWWGHGGYRHHYPLRSPGLRHGLGYRPYVPNRSVAPPWSRARTPVTPSTVPRSRPNLYQRPPVRPGFAERPAMREPRPSRRPNDVLTDREGNLLRFSGQGWRQLDQGRWRERPVEPNRRRELDQNWRSRQVERAPSRGPAFRGNAPAPQRPAVPRGRPPRR